MVSRGESQHNVGISADNSHARLWTKPSPFHQPPQVFPHPAPVSGNGTPSVPWFQTGEWVQEWLQPISHGQTCSYSCYVPMFLKHHLSSIPRIYGDNAGAACPNTHIHAYRGFWVLENAPGNRCMDCSGMLPICMKPNR
jgi:hypothetical protein